MATHISHSAIPYPIKNARYTVLVPFLDATGTPTDPTTPDSEVSQDGGAFADAAEEVSTISGTNGMGYLTLSGAETNNSAVGLAFKVASGPKATLMTVYPRNLPVLSSGTLSAGSAGGGTLNPILAYDITGCFIRTTGGTGGGGTGGANNQARRIVTYTTSTGAFTVTPNWETTPSTDTTYDVLCPEGVTPAMLKALNPTTPGRTLVVDSAGLADANTVKVGPTGSGTAQTAGDIIGDTNDIQTRLPAALVSGRIDASVGAMANDTLTSAALAGSAVTEIQTGLSTLDAAGVRAAVGLASANLDTQLSTIDDFLDTEIGAIKSKTDNLPPDPADASDIAAAFGTVNTKLDAIDDFVDTEVAAIKGQTDKLTFDASNRLASNLKAVNDDATAAANLAKTTRAIGRGTAAAGGSTTSIPTSAFAPAGVDADQFKGRIITFDADTATAALRGQATDITANTAAATPTFTVTALSSAPANGDTFSVT